MIMGLYPHAHGIVTNVNRRDYPAIPSPPTEEGVKAAELTTEKLLHSAGYSTHHYGKWHLRDEDLPYYPDMYGEHQEYAREMAAVFERVRQRPRETWMDWYGWALPVSVSPAFRAAVASTAQKWSHAAHAEFIGKAGLLQFPLKDVFDVRVADRTAERIHSPGSRPWMVTCSFNYPHDPNVVPSPYYESFAAERMPLPSSFGQPEARFAAEWSRRIVEDTGQAGIRELLRIYHASVRLIDDQVGRVLNALEHTGQAGNTIVVFSSDHGDMAGGHGMFWKSTTSFYDEIVRIPLIIRWPGRIKPGRSGAAAGQVDFMPTLLDLAGQKIPAQVQGQSLAPYLTGESGAVKVPLYSFCERVRAQRGHVRKIAPGTPGGFMIRGDGWKYVRYPDGEEFLYHLEKDPGEAANLADSRRHESRKKDLRRELDAWLARTGCPLQ
jgi:arylsulfatase A-like enzyme